MGADSILAFRPIFPPLGFRPYSSKELYEHFKSMTDAVDIHVLPYAQALDPIPVDVIKRLIDEGRISYMKFAFQSVEMLQTLEKTLGDKLFKFCGADEWTLRYILLGCKGIMTATAAVFPEENVELLSLAQRGDIEGARKY